jgi:hypothetical protein
MAFIFRCTVCLLLAFLLYPVLFVFWHGPDRDFGFDGAVIMMMFFQFVSPLHLWKAPLAAAVLVAILWQYIAGRNSASSLR